MQTNSNDSAEYLYAIAVLTKLYTDGIISARVFETAVRKAKIRFNKNISAS